LIYSTELKHIENNNWNRTGILSF